MKAAAALADRDIFGAVAAETVVLRSRQQTPLRQFVHPVFAAGLIYAREVVTGNGTSGLLHQVSQQAEDLSRIMDRNDLPESCTDHRLTQI